MAAPTLEMWVSSLLTLIIWSYILYKENPVYRFAESTLVAVTLGNSAVMAVKSLQTSGITPLMAGNATIALPIALGVLIFLQYSKNYNKIAQWPVAILTGVGLAVAIRGSGHTYVYNQVRAAFTPLNNFNNLLVLVTTCATLFYFLYTIDVTKNPVTRGFHTTGRYSIMLYLGGMFGSVVMTRLTYVSGVVDSLMTFFKSLLGY